MSANPMQIKPSADLLQALGTMPAASAPRPQATNLQPTRTPAAPKMNMPTAADLKSTRNFRPGTFLDIYV
jgi:hypothetical protein